YQSGFCDGDDEAVIVCDFLEMAENVDWSTNAPKILFQHNVETLIWRRYFENESNTIKKAYFNFEQKRLAEYEKTACNKFDLIFTVSEEDKALLRDDFGVTTPIEVIETGVDTNFFKPAETIDPTPGRLLFLGSMDWMPNIDGIDWFVSNVYPLIKKTRPRVSLQIVGRRPGREVRRLTGLDPSINVIGDVPDVRPYIAGAELFIVPLRIGGGSRIKIYEAMAMRRPVISTTIGAEGLPVDNGEHILLGDRPEQFADRVNDLLANPDKRDRIAANGFNLVREKYQWKSVARKFHSLCQELTTKERRSAVKK
ncbi:MAG TPA: glycosyltransferase, partial [candidate division Zixibacteria bacterium]|nr:glycosyltransferase [candidate division Zixibacteria bacterium]